MNDSDTNKSETFGSLYNYFDSPTLEWDESNPITQVTFSLDFSQYSDRTMEEDLSLSAIMETRQ